MAKTIPPVPIRLSEDERDGLQEIADAVAKGNRSALARPLLLSVIGRPEQSVRALLHMFKGLSDGVIPPEEAHRLLDVYLGVEESEDRQVAA